MVNSTHKAEVIEINEILNHPNADNLELIKPWGYTCCVRKGDFQVGDLAVFIVPDSIVDTNRPEFAFLGEHNHITVRRFRGVFSQGLLVHAPNKSNIGDDVSEIFGITRYEPSIKIGKDEATTPPKGFFPRYDLETWYRYKHLLIPDEFVVVTEKIHGASARYCFVNEQMHCSSRNEWKKQDSENVYWKCLKHNPWIEEFCREFPQLSLYGEVIPTQKLKYGRTINNIGFLVFDIWDYKSAKFISWLESNNINDWVRSAKDFQWVPVLYQGRYNDALATLSDGQSLIPGANNIREGIVIQPINERFDPTVGRVKLKLVSNTYLEKHV